MTEQDFLKFHSGYFGEPVDKLGQIARICFTGEELFEYLQDFINQTAPVFEVKVVDRVISIDTIICPNCEKIQEAEVTQSLNTPFATYIKNCECGYTIMESEWELI